MKKNEILSIVTIGLSSILYFVYNLINLIQSDDTNLWINIGSLLYTILLIVALAYAIIEKRYLAGLIVTSLKITFPYGNKFLSPLFTAGQVKLNEVGEIFYFIFAIMLIISIVTLILQANNTPFVGQRYDLKSFVGPLLVLIFLLVFSSYDTAIISSLAEVASLLLLAVMTAEFLFLSVFITVPFDFIQRVVNNDDILFVNILHLIVGLLLLAYGVYALITHIKHSHHHDEGKVLVS